LILRQACGKSSVTNYQADIEVTKTTDIINSSFTAIRHYFMTKHAANSESSEAHVPRDFLKILGYPNTTL